MPMLTQNHLFRRIGDDDFHFFQRHADCRGRHLPKNGVERPVHTGLA